MERGALSVMTTGASLMLVLCAECSDLETLLLLTDGKMCVYTHIHVCPGN